MILKELREKKGLTQGQLAVDLGLQRNTISRYETGDREPDFEMLLKLSDFFNVTIDYLLTGEEQKKMPPTEAGRIKEKIYTVIDSLSDEEADKAWGMVRLMFPEGLEDSEDVPK